MKGNDTIRRLEVGNIGVAFKKENHPVLIACLKEDSDYHMYLKQLEKVAASISDSISVYFVLSDLFTYFSECYGVGGTPTFLVIRNEEVLGTLLGKNSVRSIIEFSRECLSRCSESYSSVPGRKETPTPPDMKKNPVRKANHG